MKKYTILTVVLVLSLCAAAAFAAPLKVFVGDMNVLGAVNRDEMKLTVQSLLASRINSDTIMSVASAAEADVLISGTYVAIGKVFSVDALVKTTGGQSVTRAFVQGESQEQLIPALGELADKIKAALTKTAGTPAVQTAPGSGLAGISAGTSDFIKAEPVKPAAVTEFIKPREMERSGAGGWLSKRLTGAANLMAVGTTRPDNSRDLFLAEDRHISYYRQSTGMQLVAELELRSSEKIISLDTIETAGTIELYASIMRGDEISSQVWQVKGDKLVLAAEKLSYFFRTMSLAGGPKKLYAQSMGRDTDFFGEVFEAERSGTHISVKNPLKMPRYGSIYNFNQFRDAAGELFTTVLNTDNYLIVYDRELKELWRSNDKFGGSELYFQKEDPANIRVSGDAYRWVFLNQRIQVTARGDILVGKNEGFWVLGNARSYKKGAVYCLHWNGSSLEEKWRTRDTQNYMPDYFLDEGRAELLILQVVQRPGASTRGASALSIKKVE